MIGRVCLAWHVVVDGLYTAGLVLLNDPATLADLHSLGYSPPIPISGVRLNEAMVAGRAVHRARCVEPGREAACAGLYLEANEQILAGWARPCADCGARVGKRCRITHRDLGLEAAKREVRRDRAVRS